MAEGPTVPQAAWAPKSQRNQVIFGRPSATTPTLTDFFVKDVQNDTKSALGKGIPGRLVAVSGSAR